MSEERPSGPVERIVGRHYRDAHGVLCRRLEFPAQRMVYELRKEADVLDRWDWVVCFAGKRLIWRRSLRNAIREAEKHALLAVPPNTGIQPPATPVG